MPRVTILLVAVFMLTTARWAAGEAASQPSTATAAHLPEIVVTTGLEEGKKVLVATLKLDGKPLEGAKVSFFVRRTFGNLLLGQERTLDDGTAAVPFPEGLPGGESGKLQVLAKIVEPALYAS